MILRVWAMYDRSRLILHLLLALFFVEIVSVVVAAAVYSDPRNVIGVIIQVLDYSFCSVQFTPLIWGEVTSILQITFSVVLCVLAIVQFVRRSLQMYDATKRWQLNRYINLLIKEGIVYFFAIFLLNSISLLTDWGSIPSDTWQSTLRSIVENVPAYTLAPRFIISIRELYARDVQGRRGGGIDTGFGMSTLSGNGAADASILFAENGVAETVEADDGQNEGSENSGQGRFGLLSK
ncbi:hypothetical protein JVU11DRAFT_3011 [Chiua virens]|nr:hypothetical protein JVU11DRAFT_3011 [Chiua virens]